MNKQELELRTLQVPNVRQNVLFLSDAALVALMELNTFRTQNKAETQSKSVSSLFVTHWPILAYDITYAVLYLSRQVNSPLLC